jgi:hypothetical protein
MPVNAFGTTGQRAVTAAGADMDLILCSARDVSQGEAATAQGDGLTRNDRDHGMEGLEKRIMEHFGGHRKGNRRLAARHAERNRPQAKTAGLGSERGADAATVC